MNQPQITAYLDRIAYRGPTDPTLTALQGLMLAHLRTVPFENLSIHHGETIVLEEAWLFDKIVKRRRGGFCYELNGLFYHLLSALGFEVEMLSAGVAKQGGFGPAFDHLMLRITLDNSPWLVDVGFGDAFQQPLRLNSCEVQSEVGCDYRISEAGPFRMLATRKPNEGWKPQYRFGLLAQVYDDFRPMCVHHQTSAESTFTQKRVCTRATVDGRITLTDSSLITTTQRGERHEQPVSESERADMLNTHFGIRL